MIVFRCSCGNAWALRGLAVGSGDAACPECYRVEIGTQFPDPSVGDVLAGLASSRAMLPGRMVSLDVAEPGNLYPIATVQMIFDFEAPRDGGLTAWRRGRLLCEVDRSKRMFGRCWFQMLDPVMTTLTKMDIDGDGWLPGNIRDLALSAGLGSALARPGDLVLPRHGRVGG